MFLSTDTATFSDLCLDHSCLGSGLYFVYSFIYLFIYLFTEGRICPSTQGESSWKCFQKQKQRQQR